MIKSYELKFFDTTSTSDQVLYERYVNTMHQLLVDSGLFTSVEKNIPATPSQSNPYNDYYVTAYIGDDPVVKFELYNAPVTNASYKTLNCQRARVYYSNGTSSATVGPSFATSTNTTGLGFRRAYVTSNGVILQLNAYVSGVTVYWGSLIIARSSKNYPLIAGPTSDGFPDSTRNNIVNCHSRCIISACYGDESRVLSGDRYGTTQDFYNFNTTAKQTLMFPFTAYGEPNGEYSYSKYALWIPFAPATTRNGGFQKVLVNGKSYVIDGYYALRDD